MKESWSSSSQSHGLPQLARSSRSGDFKKAKIRVALHFSLTNSILTGHSASAQWPAEQDSALAGHAEASPGASHPLGSFMPNFFDVALPAAILSGHVTESFVP